jgi:hypothetical protein
MQHYSKFFPVALVVLLVSCQPKKEDILEYKPLKDFSYTPASITRGSEIELLAFSGGEKSDENTIYYYQFIGIDKSSGDTVRIISSLISVEESPGVENKTYTTPLQFDPGKGITTAEFEPSDSSQRLAAEFNATATTNEKLSEEQIKQIIEGKSNKKELVVINKSISLFQRDYKAAMGVLNFKKMPW